MIYFFSYKYHIHGQKYFKIFQPPRFNITVMPFNSRTILCKSKRQNMQANLNAHLKFENYRKVHLLEIGSLLVLPEVKIVQPEVKIVNLNLTVTARRYVNHRRYFLN